ncbi:uncharacterized protein LOC120341495 isoform X4 [Styela clava]
MAGVSNSDEGYILAHPSQLKDVKRKCENIKKFKIWMLTLKRLDSRYIKDLEYCLERCLLNDVSIRECFKDPGQLHKVLRAMKNNKLVNKDNQIQLDIRENGINFDCIITLRKLIKKESISALDFPEDLKMEFATAILEAVHSVSNEMSVLSMKWAVLSEASITYLHAMLHEKRITKYLSLAGCRGEHGLLLKHHLKLLKREASKQRELNTEWFPVYNEVDDPYVAITKLPPRLSSMYLALESGNVFKMGYQAKKTVTKKLKKMKNSVAKKSKKHQSSEEQIRMSDLKVDEHSDDHQNSTDDNLDQSSDEENLDYVNEHSEIVNGSSNLEEELKGLENLDLEKIDPSLKHVRGGNQSITVNIQQYVARGDIHDVKAQNVAYDNARVTATGSSTFMPRQIRNTEYPQIEYSEQDERLLPELPGLNESPEQRQQNIPTQSEPKIKTVTKCTKQDSVKIKSGTHVSTQSKDDKSANDKISTKTILEDNDVQDGYKHQEIVIQEPIKDKSLEHEATCPSTIFQKKFPNEEEVQGRTKQNNSTSQNNEIEQKITEQRQSCPPELQSTHAKTNSRYRPTENTNLLTTTDSNDGASYFQDNKSGEEVDENITSKDNGTFINSHQRIQRMNVQENLSDDRSYLELTPLLPTKLPLNGDNAKTVLGHEKINTNIRKEEESDETVALVMSKIVVKSASIKRNKTLSKVTNIDANYNIIPFLGEDGEIINDTKMIPEKQNKNLDSVLNRTASHKYEKTTLPRNASQPIENVATPKTNKLKENCFQVTEASQVQRKAATLPRKSSNIQNDTIHDGSGKVASILEQENKNGRRHPGTVKKTESMKQTPSTLPEPLKRNFSTRISRTEPQYLPKEIVHSEEASKLISTRQKSVKDSTSIFESSSYESNADAGHSAEVAEVIAKKQLSVKERAAMYQSSLKRKKN